MIGFTTGNIFEKGAEALVNPVNCVGVMGRGLRIDPVDRVRALQFKNDFPENFKAYVTACGREEVRPGKMFVFETRTQTNPKFIINFPTKRHWRDKSRLDDIELGLNALAAEIRERNIQSIAIPALGCGLGGLNWADVRQRILVTLGPISDVRITVCVPGW